MSPRQSADLRCRGTDHTLLLRTSALSQNEEQPVLLKRLVHAGANVRERDGRGDTCLHHLITTAQPEQPWVLRSLTTLLDAGADPTLSNNAGDTTIDVACDAPPELGSFRRDLLLQALLESSSDIPERLLLHSTKLTRSYTRMHNANLFLDRSMSPSIHLRAELLETLTDAAEQRNILSCPKLRGAALDRVLTAADYIDPEVVLREALAYLTQMCEAKQQLVSMCRDRIPNHTVIKFAPYVDLLQFANKARMAALLDFDWNRPVDMEDMFAIYVDHLIEQLEDLAGPNEIDVDVIEDAIEVLQNAIPSYRACSLRSSSSGNVSMVDPFDVAGSTKELPMLTTKMKCVDQSTHWMENEAMAQERTRQESNVSIVKTPVEFYRPEF
ncbi:hypothetical protein LTR37_015214 [Vermiconidia calcicola]|uniref:Uncharacterized protein n=1 Tax=Vermiconidia calcicola TaxID=1690605 RepID=A0ACC3MRB6_9PEZI|nr:hypothetical protein LTR37_015214 [Vermiconidia calcicola]